MSQCRSARARAADGPTIILAIDPSQTWTEAAARLPDGWRLDGLRIESSDPRLSGAYTLFGNGQAWPLDEAGAALVTVMSGTVRIENEDGAWTGTRVSYAGVDYADFYHVRGEGAYEGLTAVFHWVAAEARDDEAFMTYSGVVIPGPLPDYPELPAT